MTSLISLMPASTALNGDEVRVRHLGDHPRERRLAGAGRSPEDDRLQQVALDRFAQRLAGREDVVLADDLVERARAHALGERRSRRGRRTASEDPPLRSSSIRSSKRRAHAR